MALLERGQQRFDIYCSPCHSRVGDGDGMIVQRGFPHPPSYFIDRLIKAPDQHFYDVITHGYGAMYSYADRVEPADRWAIIAYIRALQASASAGLADVPADNGRPCNDESGAPMRVSLVALAALVLGVLGCAIGAAIDVTGFFRAWLCSYLFWLGLPLAGVTLVLVHDLSGGKWMATARPVLDAAIATMPLATLAGIPAFVGLHALYSWTHPAPSLGNTFYLNSTGFYLRYAIYVVLWNLLAAFALWAPRGEAAPIPPGLSWISGVGLIVLAFSAGFASIDWIMSLEPEFWSSIFSYSVGASWFNTGLAFVLFVVAVSGRAHGPKQDHMADLAAILLATTIFWAYVEFMQFLIIWEENLKSEIPWYLLRIAGVWKAALYVSIGFGFILPFFVLLWRPSKRSRGVVVTICILLVVSRVADKWWLVMPEFAHAPPFWLALAAIAALGGPMILLFAAAQRYRSWFNAGWPMWKAAAHD